MYVALHIMKRTHSMKLNEYLLTISKLILHIHILKEQEKQKTSPTLEQGSEKYIPEGGWKRISGTVKLLFIFFILLKLHSVFIKYYYSNTCI